MKKLYPAKCKGLRTSQTYRGVAITLLVLSLELPAFCNDSTSFDKGMARYLNLQFVPARIFFEQASKQNIAEASTLLANIHLRGEGVLADVRQAEKLALQGETLGDFKSYYILGMIERQRNPSKESPMVGHDYFSKAIPAMEKSSKLGSIFWATRLGFCFSNGLGVEQDFEKTKMLYQKCASSGYAVAIHNLGVMYKDGEGVQVDYSKALELLRASSKKGFANSCWGIHDIAQAYHYGNDYVAADIEKAMTLYGESCGLAQAYTNMARLYLFSDIPKALNHFESAITLGDGEAACALGFHYLKIDTAKAHHYFLKALALTDDSGQPEAGLSQLYAAERGKSELYAFRAIVKGADNVTLPEFEIGSYAPEIELKDTKGQFVRLSQLRGQYVLIDFWASWCGPCRMENPNVVKLYEEYHQKGFEIFGVSLDEDPKRWMAAIAKDGLPWVHVSDLKGWEAAITKWYGVSSIPQTVLLDKEGKIMAIGLRGEELREKLAGITF